MTGPWSAREFMLSGGGKRATVAWTASWTQTHWARIRGYVQAKRYRPGNNVGAGPNRDFFGNLARYRQYREAGSRHAVQGRAGRTVTAVAAVGGTNLTVRRGARVAFEFRGR